MPYLTKPYPEPLYHIPIHSTVLHQNWAEPTKIDQSQPYLDLLRNRPESTFLRNRPPLHFVFIPLWGRPPHVISAFSLFPSPRQIFFWLCFSLKKLRFEMSTAHIWTLACSGLERCFITAVCKRQIDYLDNLNNQLASAQTLIQIQIHTNATDYEHTPTVVCRHRIDWQPISTSILPKSSSSSSLASNCSIKSSTQKWRWKLPDLTFKCQ